MTSQVFILPNKVISSKLLKIYIWLLLWFRPTVSSKSLMCSEAGLVAGDWILGVLYVGTAPTLMSTC